MDVFLFALVLVVLTAIVARPLYVGAPPFSLAPGERAARRRVLVRALSDLEVDRASGLVSAECYEAERAALESEAAALGREADEGP